MSSTKAALPGGHRGCAESQDTASNVISAEIERATAQLDACPDDPCRRAWGAVLDGLEEMLPVGVGERVEYLYAVPPIDDWTGWSEPPADAQALVQHARRCIERHSHWGLPIREGPYTAPLPDPERCAQLFMVAIKIDNNGTTFIWSPLRLPWLDGYR